MILFGDPGGHPQGDHPGLLTKPEEPQPTFCLQVGVPFAGPVQISAHVNIP